MKISMARSKPGERGGQIFVSDTRRMVYVDRRCRTRLLGVRRTGVIGAADLSKPAVPLKAELSENLAEVGGPELELGQTRFWDGALRLFDGILVGPPRLRLKHEPAARCENAVDLGKEGTQTVVAVMEVDPLGQAQSGRAIQVQRVSRDGSSN